MRFVALLILLPLSFGCKTAGQANQVNTGPNADEKKAQLEEFRARYVNWLRAASGQPAEDFTYHDGEDRMQSNKKK